MGKGGQRPPSDADKGLIASEYGCRPPARKIHFMTPSKRDAAPRVDVGARGDGVGPSSPGPAGASDADSAPATPSPLTRYNTQGPK